MTPQERERAILDGLPIAHETAWRLHSLFPLVPRDELTGCANLALVEAVDAYSGGALSQWLQFKTRCLAIDELRREGYADQAGRITRLRFEQFPLQPNGRLADFQALGPTPEQACVRAEIPRLVDGLWGPARTAMRMFYFDDQTRQQCGETLGVSASRIGQLLASARAVLRKRLQVVR